MVPKQIGNSDESSFREVEIVIEEITQGQRQFVIKSVITSDHWTNCLRIYSLKAVERVRCTVALESQSGRLSARFPMSRITRCLRFS